ncbi:MAG TPA: peptide-methionine (S)-S-oxide reductase MsrA [Gammaproteobacteria bacterium]|nr:peptide-methionine (S)-S-oxide reductase MsrA [Gammaproteobacteria bacterium]
MFEDTETAILGGGCFWCLEAVFREVDGVEEVVSGYAGGHLPDPDYRSVCSGDTGHAEVVRLRFDPARIGFRDILEIFFTIHDPTQLNRQGNDVGPQYRSVIFCLDDEQRRIAAEIIDEINAAGAFDRPIVTELAGDAIFYPAEAYHQAYFEHNAGQPYCQVIIAPKLKKFRERHAALRSAAD